MRCRLLLFPALVAGALLIYALFPLSEGRNFGVSPGLVDPNTPVSSLLTDTDQPTYEIVTLIPPDTILAIDEPQFVSGAEADAQYHDEELVIGVAINDDARAYSIPFLSRHEIVNDVVGGQPVAVTW